MHDQVSINRSGENKRVKPRLLPTQERQHILAHALGRRDFYPLTCGLPSIGHTGRQRKARFIIVIEIARAAFSRRLQRFHLSLGCTKGRLITPRAQTAAHPFPSQPRSEEHTSELQSRQYLVCRLLLEKK